MINKNIKVLVVIPYITEVYGGPSKVVKELAQSLGLQTIDVDVITTNANGLEKLDASLNGWLCGESYRVQYFNCAHRNDSILSFSLISWFAKNAANYDVIHTHNLFAPMMSVIRWICAIKKIPYVVTPHGMLEPWALAYKSYKKKLYYQLFEAPTLKKANAIHVLNQQEAEHVKALGFQQIVTLPNGIRREVFAALPDVDVFYQAFPETKGKQLILFLGRIDPKKGIDLLAPAFAQVRQRFPNSHLVIAGPDSINFLPIAQGYLRDEGCLDAVTFTGMLTGELKYAALAAADVYVAPSYSEGFSMSVLEGMAAGLPCVITTGCNFPEAAEAGVAAVVEIDSKAIANALNEMLADLPKAKQMGLAAREFVFQQYTWDKIAAKLIHLYLSIVNKPTLP